MGKPKFEVEEKDYYKDIHFLYEIVGMLKNVEEIKKFFKDILTRSELRMIKRRWHIANLLSEGFDIRTVAYKSKTSTQTVSKIKQILEEGQGGLRLALERMSLRIKQERTRYIDSKRARAGSKYVKGWLK